ncbi:MAG: hypothetical protein M5R36_05460 [Deltaproteobacteria bacterium]|nr:hypothetical protein [Deltaproteobacteria bacterium]
MPAFVDAVLADTGTGKVDMVAHSMGAWAGRWYIKFLGGETKIRDYVSLAGTNHGNNAACLFAPFSESSAELCPAYAGDGDSENNIQFLLNGEPSVEDVDETPFGIEDGGEIAWHAMWAGLDEVVYPNTSACLNQTSRNDCSDPINKIAAWTFHLQMIQSQAVFDQVEIWLRERNISRP